MDKGKDKSSIELSFKLNSSDILIAKAKECIKTFNIELDMVEFNNINSLKLITNHGKLISLNENNTITVSNAITGEKCYANLSPEDHQKNIQSYFLSIDHNRLFTSNSEIYTVWDLNQPKMFVSKEFKTRKDLFIAYEKKKKNAAFIADPRGNLYIWKAGVMELEKIPELDENLFNAIKSISAFDISFDDSEMLIEVDNDKILIFDKTNHKHKPIHFKNDGNTIYSSLFSSKDNNIFSILITSQVTNSHIIIEWDGKTGEKLKKIESNKGIMKMMIEPNNNILILLTDANSLMMCCPKNEIFIKLIDEDENLDNFFLNQNNDLALIFKKKEEKVHICNNLYNNSCFLIKNKKKFCSIFSEYEKNLTLESLNARMFPFNYNFLQILAYDDILFHDIEDKLFETLSKKKINIHFKLFFQKDLHGRNCFDTAFASRDTKLFKDLLSYIILNENITNIPAKYQRYLNSEFFYRIFQMFENNPIINEFLNFVFSEPLKFPKKLMYPKLKEPLFKLLDEPSFSEEETKKFLKIHETNKIKNKFDEVVKAKCFFPYEFLDYNNANTREIFKLVSNFAPTNQIFGNQAIIKILKYKWETYGMRRYAFEAFLFFIFLSLYVLNADYFFIIRLSTESETTIYHFAYSIASVITDVFLLIFVFYLLWEEVKQIRTFGRKDYFSSFWNYNDFAYIFFTLLSTTLDLFSCFDLILDFSVLKAFQSLAIFFAFFRMLSYARGIEGSSFMIKLIIEVIFDIRYFLILMMIFILSLSCSGKLLKKEISFYLSHKIYS